MFDYCTVYLPKGSTRRVMCSEEQSDPHKSRVSNITEPSYSGNPVNILFVQLTRIQTGTKLVRQGIISRK